MSLEWYILENIFTKNANFYPLFLDSIIIH